jgi:hypothetical protein
MTTDTTPTAVDANTEVSTSPQAQEVKTFVEATNTFLEALPALGKAQRPLVTLLQHLAVQLDTNGVSNAQLVNQYRLTLKALQEGTPPESGVDEDEAFLNGE